MSAEKLNIKVALSKELENNSEYVKIVKERARKGFSEGLYDVLKDGFHAVKISESFYEGDWQTDIFEITATVKPVDAVNMRAYILNNPVPKKKLSLFKWLKGFLGL